MILTLRSDAAVPYAICENDKEKSILQNIALILSTKQGTNPMHRSFGIPMNYVGKPLMVAETIVTAEVTEAIQMFEPRAVLRDVKIEYDKKDLGEFILIVEVDI